MLRLDTISEAVSAVNADIIIPVANKVVSHYNKRCSHANSTLAIGIEAATVTISRRTAAAIVVLALLASSAPDVRMRNLARSWRKVLKEIRTSSLLDYVQRPRAGEAEALPPKVIVMISLLRDHGVAAYRYSPEHREHNEWTLMEEYQRLTEGAYPARQDERAPFLLQYDSDPLPPGCTEKTKRGGIVLALCP